MQGLPHLGRRRFDHTWSFWSDTIPIGGDHCSGSKLPNFEGTLGKASDVLEHRVYDYLPSVLDPFVFLKGIDEELGVVLSQLFAGE